MPTSLCPTIIQQVRVHLFPSNPFQTAQKPSKIGCCAPESKTQRKKASEKSKDEPLIGVFLVFLPFAHPNLNAKFSCQASRMGPVA